VIDMHYVLLAEHSADVCPTANAATRKLMLETAPRIPAMAQEAGVTIVAGPFVNREHLTVVVVEADSAEKVDRFLVAGRLPQWNSVRVLPSLPIQQALAEIEEMPALF
jgi:hypothetical protein